MTLNRHSLLLAGGGLAIAGALPAFAQDKFPSKPLNSAIS